MFDRHDSLFTRQGAVTTSSRLKKWWLVSIRKWTVSHYAREPLRVTLGQMVYKHTWILMPPRAASSTPNSNG
jgi:hypothetical protein